MLKIELSYRGMLTIVGLLFAVWALTKLWPVILLVLISLVLMVGLLPYVEAMVRAGLPRTAAVLVLVFGLLAVVIGLISLMVPPLVTEAEAVRDNLPASAREVEVFLGHLGVHIELQQKARDINWDEIISGSAAVNYGQRVLSTTISLITIVAMTAYLLAETPRLGSFIGQFIPRGGKDDAEKLFYSITRVVGGYLRGQLITSLSIGIFTFALLRIVGISNPLAFAVLAGLADVVPLVGALIAVAPPVAAALQESSTQAGIVLVGLMLYQQFEDRILVPRVYGRTLNLPPLIVLIAVLAGAELLGVTGVLLALPLAAAARVGIDYLLEKRLVTMSSSNASPPPDEPLMPADPVEQPLAPDIPGEHSHRVFRAGIPAKDEA
jgi:predicted PurR-regulated permease PerM